MKYCEDDLPVKIVFANDLLKFFGDALVAIGLFLCHSPSWFPCKLSARLQTATKGRQNFPWLRGVF